MFHLCIDFAIHYFTLVDEFFENCLCKTPHIGIILTICTFAVVEENFENCLNETPQIGINLTVYSFAMIDFFNCLYETPQIGISWRILWRNWSKSDLCWVKAKVMQNMGKRRKENFEINLQRGLLQISWGASNLLLVGLIGHCPNAQ